MDQRQERLIRWLSQDLNYQLISLAPASADASFRRYFRAVTKQGTFVVMDAPPDKESITAFLRCATALQAANVHAPAIYAQDQTLGFIVLEDLGDRTYLDELADNANALYSDAIDCLIKIQASTKSNDFAPPAYGGSKLVDEMSLFPKWFISKHLGQTLHEPSFAVWMHTQQSLVMACLEQPQVWVHRDYHSRNLMITQQDSPGVIDFQDMVVGAIGYDLASLFKDCYIEWPRAQQHQWLQEYHSKAKQQLALLEFSFEQLIRWVDFAGLQRHLKVLGIFCRLNYRDGKNNYLNDLPMVARYVLEVLQLYPELSTFKDHFEGHISSVL